MELDSLLSALEERANTARTVFMLLDSDVDGLVARPGRIESVRLPSQNAGQAVKDIRIIINQ